VLALAAAVRLGNLAILGGLPVAEYELRWNESDMATVYRWSGRIVSGDILGRDTVHQYTDWMASIAPPEVWERWWGGKGVFHQAPLYAYAVAGMRFVVGDGFWPIALCQMGLGLLNVALVFLLAARFFDRTVATAAALGAALYGPFLLHEPLLLRDTLAVSTSLLLLWGLSRCDEARPGPWLVAGFLFALAVLAREATLLFAPFVAVRFRHGAWPRVLAAFAAGAVLGFAPLVARNVVVGVAPWALSTRAIEGFIYGHAAGGSPVGVQLPPATRSILEAADGRLGTAIRLTLATYHGDAWALGRRELAKLAAIFSRYEGMDNVNWYYFADRSPVLRCALRYEWVLALGLFGLWCARKSAARHRVLWSFLLAAIGGLMYATVVGRYRLVPAAVLMIYAGAAVVWLGRAFRGGRWAAAAGGTAAVLGLIVASGHLLGRIPARERYRSAEFFLAGQVYYQHGDPARALEEVRTGLRMAYRGPDQPTLPPGYLSLVRELVQVARELGRDRDAAADLERLAADYPADADVESLLGVVYRDGLQRPDEAERHFDEAARRLHTH